jgi:hypothetical protein
VQCAHTHTHIRHYDLLLIKKAAKVENLNFKIASPLKNDNIENEEKRR